MKRKFFFMTVLLAVALSSMGQLSKVRARAAERYAKLHAEKTAIPASPKADTLRTATVMQQQQPVQQQSSIRVEWVEFMAPQNASLEGLYNVAMGFPRGSTEFSEILALSGRLFPKDPAACINAAGVALIRGDAKTAHIYLDDLLTDHRAYNNVALMYILDGNRDKAEVYIRLAKANGNCPGAPALPIVK